MRMRWQRKMHSFWAKMEVKDRHRNIICRQFRQQASTLQPRLQTKINTSKILLLTRSLSQLRQVIQLQELSSRRYPKTGPTFPEETRLTSRTPIFSKDVLISSSLALEVKRCRSSCRPKSRWVWSKVKLLTAKEEDATQCWVWSRTRLRLCAKIWPQKLNWAKIWEYAANIWPFGLIREKLSHAWELSNSGASSSWRSITSGSAMRSKSSHTNKKVMINRRHALFFKLGKSTTKHGKSRKTRKISRRPSRLKCKVLEPTMPKKLKCSARNSKRQTCPLHRVIARKLQCKKISKKPLWGLSVRLISKPWTF